MGDDLKRLRAASDAMKTYLYGATVPVDVDELQRLFEELAGAHRAVCEERTLVLWKLTGERLRSGIYPDYTW
jgi:hypothetical protein